MAKKKDYILQPTPGAEPLALASTVNTAVFVTDAALEGFTQKSLPPIIKPKEFPVGSVLVGLITGIMPSPIEEYKNDLLQLTCPNGDKVCFPITSVIESALEKKPVNYIGHTIAIKNLGVIPSRKDKKRRINNFQVFLKAPAKGSK
jgi:hypothetical protein